MSSNRRTSGPDVNVQHLEQKTTKGRTYWEATVTATVKQGDGTISETVVATNEHGSWMIPPTDDRNTYRELLAPAPAAIAEAIRKMTSGDLKVKKASGTP